MVVRRRGSPVTASQCTIVVFRCWQGRLNLPGKIAPIHDSIAPAAELVSIVIPVYNEAANLHALWRRLIPVIDAGNREFEVVFVDDGSSDDSLALLREFAAADARVRVVELARNFGQHSALLAGFRQCRGDIVVTLDADLQNPPEDSLR